MSPWFSTSTMTSEPSRTFKIGPGIDPLYASMRTVASPSRLATGAIRRSKCSPSDISTNSGAHALGSPDASVGKRSVGSVSAWCCIGQRPSFGLRPQRGATDGDGGRCTQRGRCRVSGQFVLRAALDASRGRRSSHSGAISRGATTATCGFDPQYLLRSQGTFADRATEKRAEATGVQMPVAVTSITERREPNAQVAYGEAVQVPGAAARDLLGLGSEKAGELPLEAQPRVLLDDAFADRVGYLAAA